MPRRAFFYTTGLIILATIISLVSAHTDSLTYDEVAHIGSGYTYILENDFRLNPEHPPLLKALAAVPLLLIAPTFDVTELPSWTTSYAHIGEFGQWDAGKLLLHASENNIDQITWLARLPMVLLFGMFSFFLYHWGKKSGNRLIGKWIGLCVVALWCFNINLLGHNHLVTTDIGAAIAMTVTLYYFLRFIKKPTWKNTIILGIIFGIASCVKFSTFILIPFFAFLILLYAILTNTTVKDILQKSLLYMSRVAVIGIITIITIYLIYTPFSFRTPENVLAQITPQKIHGTVKQIDITTRESLLALNEIPAARPLALYLHGFVQVFHRTAGGNRTYFMGNIYNQNKTDRAHPLYFPTIFTIKEPLLYLFLYTLSLILIIITSTRKIAAILAQKNVHALQTKHNLKSLFVGHFTELTLFLFIIFYGIISLSGNLTIGLRHLFPLYPPLMLLTAIILVKNYQKIKHKTIKKYARVSFSILLILLAVQAILTTPNHLSFFNILANGSNNGYHFVVDSNTDWGQGTKKLAKYLKAHNITKIHIDYFGGDDIEKRLSKEGITAIPWNKKKRPVVPGYYAISTTHLQDSLYDGSATMHNAYLWIKNHIPIAQIDSSILIYHVK